MALVTERREMPRMPVWPWSARALAPEGLAGRMRALADALQGWPVDEYECSYRIGQDGVRSDRLLLGLERLLPNHRRWAEFTRAWAMPDALARACARDARHATVCMLGIELGPRGPECRLYLGFGAQGHPDHAPLLMRGFKWLAADDASGATRATDYWRVPGGARVLLARPSDTEGASADPNSAVLARIARLAAPRARFDALEVWAATEQETLRGSVCLRLYESGLCLGDLEQIEPRSSVEQEDRIRHVRGARRRLGPRRLGWLAAGRDGAGHGFLTVYVEATREDVWPLISAGATRAQVEEAFVV